MRVLARYLIFILVPAFCISFALNAGQDINWDLQNYHLYAPYAFINARHLIDLSPAGLQSYFNPILYLAYFWLINHTSPQVSASILALIQSLNFFVVYGIALQLLPEQRAKRYIALALALMGVLSVGFISEIGTTQFDNVVSLFILAALFLVLYAVNNCNGKRAKLYFLIGGFLAGIGCAVKLVVGVYALGLCVAIFCLSETFRERFLLSCIYSSGVVIGILLVGGFWFLFMFENFGNPLFPLFNSFFGSDLAQVASSRDMRFLPKGIVDYLAYPIVFTFSPRRVSGIAYAQYSWLIVYLAIVVFFLSKLFTFNKRFRSQDSLSEDKKLFLGFFIASYFLWLLLFGIYRYLVSLDLLIPLMIFIIFGTFFSNRLYRYGALIGLAGVTWINSSGAADWGRAGWSEQIYKTEIPVGFAEANKIVLVGQPLAWLIPAFNVTRPFIQIAPNYLVSATYVNRVRDLVIDDGRLGIIYSPNIRDIGAEIPADLIQQYFPQEIEISAEGPVTILQLFLEMGVEDFACEPFTANLGQTDYNFQFCLQKD